MFLNVYDTLSEAIRKLEERGFSAQFKLEPNGLKSLESGQIYLPENLKIVEYHRFEGMSNPSDMSVIFALVAESGELGIIVMNYGAGMDLQLVSFLDNVKIDIESYEIVI